MKERPLFWPQVKIDNIDPRWWDEVMSTSGAFQDYFSNELSDAEDFTIRGIVHIIVTKDRETVSWFMDESTQKERVLYVHGLINSTNVEEKEKGREEIIKLIEDYTDDVLERK